MAAPAGPRRVRRTVRAVEATTVFKVAGLFWLCLVAVLVLALVLLWLAGSSVGVIENIEEFLDKAGFEGFKFRGGQMLRGLLGAGAVMVVVGALGSVLVATIYNLIAEVVGGITFDVVEEELPYRRRADDAPAARGRRSKRDAGGTPAAPAGERPRPASGEQARPADRNGQRPANPAATDRPGDPGGGGPEPRPPSGQVRANG